MKKFVILNEKQDEYLQKVFSWKYQIVGLVAGRSFGKTFMMAIVTWLMKEQMPRARVGIGGVTVKMVKVVTIPMLKMAWRELFGLTEYKNETGFGDFVMWKEPPAHFDKPFFEPEDWSNCITFSNGLCFELEGFKLTADENRGKNYDGYFVDEFLTFKEEWMKIIIPTLRANPGKYSSTLHHTFFFFTSPPVLKKQLHVWKYKGLAMKEPDKVLFIHGKTMDNIMNIPDDFIEKQRKALSKQVFEVEIEGKELKQNESTYYPGLTDKNIYEGYLEVAEDEVDEFYAKDRSLIASLDYNAKFTSSTIFQQSGYENRCISNVFISNNKEGKTMAESIGLEIGENFSGHRRKKIILVGDRNGHSKSAGTNRSMFEQTKVELESLGWEVSIQAASFNLKHKDKYVLVNDVLKESGVYPYKIRFHGRDAKSTLVSMELAPIDGDYNKNKDSERSGDQELATHLSDTVDYFVVWLVKGAMIDDAGFELTFF